MNIAYRGETARVYVDADGRRYRWAVGATAGGGGFRAASDALAAAFAEIDRLAEAIETARARFEASQEPEEGT